MIGVGVGATFRTVTAISASGIPSSTVLPAISGTVTVGETLTVSNGTWANLPTSYTYQWKRDGANIGTNAATYVLVIADQGATITCTVTATNLGGSTAATSAGVGPVAAYSPLALFSGGQGGAWYDPSDLSTMFQDILATIPVTADGQSVLRINDKSGNGLHLTQAVGVLAPLYKTAGGLHWLEFNGTTQFMQRAAVDLSAYFRVSLFAAARKESDADFRIILEHGPVVGSTAGTFALTMPGGAPSTHAGCTMRGATTVAACTRAAGTAPATAYITGQANLQAPSIQIRTTGVAATAVTTATGGGNFTSQVMNLGSRNGAASFFYGRIYALMFVMKTASAAEITNTENYCRLKAGL